MNTEKQLTAVDFLIERLKHRGYLLDQDIEQAKEMEKEQIEDAYLEGQINWEMNGKQYYNETFKSE